MNNICCSGTGKEGNTKEVVKDRVVKKKCGTKLYVKDVVWKRKMVCDKDGMYVRTHVRTYIYIYVFMYVSMYVAKTDMPTPWV